MSSMHASSHTGGGNHLPMLSRCIHKLIWPTHLFLRFLLLHTRNSGLMGSDRFELKGPGAQLADLSLTLCQACINCVHMCTCRLQGLCPKPKNKDGSELGLLNLPAIKVFFVFIGFPGTGTYLIGLGLIVYRICRINLSKWLDMGRKMTWYRLISRY